MKGSKFTDEQIFAIVKEGEAGRKVADLSRTYGVTEQTYDRWKAKYGGMELSEMQRHQIRSACKRPNLCPICYQTHATRIAVICGRSSRFSATSRE